MKDKRYAPMQSVLSGRMLVTGGKRNIKRLLVHTIAYFDQLLSKGTA